MNAVSYTIKIDLNELSRLLTAATVSKKFRHLLLTNPTQALANGYNGEVFHLDAQYMNRILSIQALSLHEFAQQLINQGPLSVSDEYKNAGLA
jgi:hypothetical protein